MHIDDRVHAAGNPVEGLTGDEVRCPEGDEMMRAWRERDDLGLGLRLSSSSTNREAFFPRFVEELESMNGWLVGTRD
jgi:hypothetical protein